MYSVYAGGDTLSTVARRRLENSTKLQKCSENPNKIPCVDSPGAINISSDDSYYNYTLLLIIKKIM